MQKLELEHNIFEGKPSSQIAATLSQTLKIFGLFSFISEFGEPFVLIEGRSIPIEMERISGTPIEIILGINDLLEKQHNAGKTDYVFATRLAKEIGINEYSIDFFVGSKSELLKKCLKDSTHVFGENTVGAESGAFNHTTNRQTILEVQNQMQNVLASFVNKPVTEENKEAVRKKVEECVEAKGVAQSIECGTPYSETWLTMKGVSKKRGALNFVLNRLFGNTVFKPNWLHKKLGYSVKEFETEIQGFEILEVGFLRTPKPFVMDVTIKPFASVNRINLSFAIKRSESENLDV